MATARSLGIAVAVAGVAATAVAVALFPRAFPIVALDNRLTAATALARADSFLAAHDLAPAATRRAARFQSDDSLLTYVDLAAGGTDSLNALVRGRDATPYRWSVRAFEPGDVREARVDLAPDGRVIGFRRKLAEADARPDIGADSAGALARLVVRDWLGEPGDRWTIATTSYETRKTSERVDRTFTFERGDRRIGDAPLRLDVVIAGDGPAEARPYVAVPEAFTRRYDEMRSANDLLALLSTLGMLGLLIAGFSVLRAQSRLRAVRWRPAVVAGTVIGTLLAAAGINAAGLAWFDYDTAMPAMLFQAIVFAGAVGGGVATGGVTALTLAAAESATRRAFPARLDWWNLWRHRGTREAAAQVAGGYAVAAIALAYVCVFYVVTRGAFGWWVPSSLVDDPNQIATPAPWITGLAVSLNAGVWEEALFRALPLSMLSLWVGDRPRRRWWMAAGVVVTALVFGFAHANYPSWPPYSRGVEIFLDACFWGVLFLRFGFLVTVVAHFGYDAVLFSLFAATGTATEYRVAAALAALGLLAPAIAVAWKAIRQRGLVAAPDDARFGAWSRTEPEPAAPPATGPLLAPPMSARSRRIAIIAVVAATAVAVAMPRRAPRGPAFTADRAAALAVADSMLAARGVPVAGWRRLTQTGNDTLGGWTRFLREHDADSLAELLASNYAVPAWWTVRYVHTDGSLAERVEEWRVRVHPDGRPFDLRHIVADSTPGESPPADSVRRIARRALAAAGIDTLRLREATYDETPRPHRRDVTITWTDTTVALPGGALARAWVTVAGSDVLVARRGVELPETFHRAARDARTRAIAVGGAFGVLLFVGLVGGLVYVARKRTPIVTDRVFGRKAFGGVVGVLVLSAAGAVATQWRGLVFSYDTSVPWSTHVTTTAIGAAFTLVAVLVLVGFWQLFEMVRTRAGIPAWPPEAPEARRDALLAGLGLASVMALRGWVSGAAAAAIPPAPSTALNGAAPALDGLLALPAEVVARVVVLATPILLVMALTPSARRRWLLIAAVALVGAGTVVPLEWVQGGSAVAPLAAVEAIAGAVAVVLAIRWWGAHGGYAWLVAAIASAAFDGLRDAVHDPTAVERLGGAVGAATAAAGVAWLARGRRPASLV